MCGRGGDGGGGGGMNMKSTIFFYDNIPKGIQLMEQTQKCI